MDLARIRNISHHRPHRPRQVDAGRPPARAHAAPSTPATCAPSTSTRWTSSGSGASRSSSSRSASTTRDHVINLIDTPGHVDFGYEVSRSLAACEGVILLVDAAQGIEAQTLANCYLALENDLEIVAALNKIDLPAADPDRYAAEIEKVLGIPADEILRISAKTGEGVAELLDAVIERIPPPTGEPDAPLQALIFDSHYDQLPGRRLVGPGHERHAARPAPGCGSCRPAPPTTPTRSASARPRTRRCRRSARARSATSSPASRTWARPARARRSPRPAGRRPQPLRGLPRPQADGVLRALPDRRRRVRRPARVAREAAAQRRQLHLRARDLRRARLRVPLRVPRPAPHGDRPRAARARVRPQPHRHRAVGGVPGPHDRRRGDRDRQPLGDARRPPRSSTSRSRA